MSQVSTTAIGNVTFAQFRTNLNNTLGALNSNHVGGSQPANAETGQIWIDNSVSGTLTMKIVDSDGQDLTLFSLNESTNVVTLPSTVAITEVDPDALPLAIALG